MLADKCCNPLIQKALATAYSNDLAINQIYKRNTRNHVTLPLFLIHILRQQNNTDLLFQIANILGLQVQMKKFRGCKCPIQCHNCQGYTYSAAVCHLPSKCGKCAGPKPYDIPCKCALCDGLHPANYILCPMHPSEQN